MVARILNVGCSLFFAWEMPVPCAKGRTKLSKYLLCNQSKWKKEVSLLYK